MTLTRDNTIAPLNGPEGTIPTLLVGEIALAADTHRAFVGTASGNVQVCATRSDSSLPTASAAYLGVLFFRTSDSTLWIGTSTPAWVAVAPSSSYTLPTASASVLGGIKIGANLTIDGSGVVSAAASGGSTGASINKSQLDYVLPSTWGDYATGVAIATGWHDVIADQTFTVDDAQSVITIETASSLMAHANSGNGLFSFGILIDGATRYIVGKFFSTGGTYSQLTGACRTLELPGLSVGSHTVRFQIDGSVAGIGILDPVGAPDADFLTIKVIERKIASTGASGTLDQAKVYKTANTSISSATSTAIPFDAEDWDTNGLHDNATDNTRLTIQNPGKYRISGVVEFAANNVGGRIALVRKNGATNSGRNQITTGAGNGGPYYLPFLTELPLVAGDYVEIVAYQDSGSPLNIVGGTIDDTFCTIERIDGYAINPMTAASDVIVGGASGVPTRQAAAAGKLLGWDSTGAVGAIGGMQKIAPDVVLASPAASIAFSSIPAGFSDLMLVIAGRGTASALNEGLFLRFNGDSGANYGYIQNWGTGGGSSGSLAANAQTKIIIGNIPAGTAPANVFGMTRVQIPQYLNTHMWKALFAESWYRSDTSTQFERDLSSGDWWNTAAVTSIALTLAAGNFDTNTVATLYGIY